MEAHDPWLTTGEAAKLLGVTRQHIVDLCNAGDLPYTTVGSHRRLRRSEVDGLQNLRQGMTADQLRSLLLAHLVAARLVLEPKDTVRLARTNLERMLAGDVRGAVRRWLQEWSRLLDGPLTDLLAALTSPSPRSRELRQNSPFAGVLTDDERALAVATSRVARRPVAP